MNIEMHNGDAFNMEFIESATIDKIITDPPWGEFNKIESLDDFYIKMFHEFDRVLKKNRNHYITTLHQYRHRNYHREPIQNKI